MLPFAQFVARKVRTSAPHRDERRLSAARPVRSRQRVRDQVDAA